MQGEVGLWGRGDGEEVGAVHVFETEGGARVGVAGGDFDVGHFEILEVANEEAVAGSGAEPEQFGVGVFHLGDLEGVPVGHGLACVSPQPVRHILGQAFVVEVAVGELDVFDEVFRDAGEDGCGGCERVVADEVGDEDAAERAGAHRLFGPAVAAVEAEEERRVDGVAHGVASDGDVFEQRAVGGFERDALGAFDDVAGDGDVAEAAVGFRAALDAAVARDLARRRRTSSMCRR